MFYNLKQTICGGVKLLRLVVLQFCFYKQVMKYYLDGSTIIAENRKTGTNNNLIYYIYDMMGLSGFVYNGANYYYEKNTLGDIIGIINSSGTQVATYTYDAWGNILTKTGSMADINPFRYRGYYYDTETGFYYLQTRYYDPIALPAGI